MSGFRCSEQHGRLPHSGAPCGASGRRHVGEFRDRPQRVGDRAPGSLTTSLVFSDCPAVLQSATCATALIDRIVHHADAIAISGKS
ncbi:ATP-binding protein [Sorangium sp. So ce1335]|uniref:ATP-binding protein n=1 Tax=Sorangium sp. So ce1335 TaxID=3133335 RepID=UPI003F63E738